MVAIAHTPVADDAWSSEWNGTDDPAATAPWLFDIAGSPIEFSGEVVGFRARYLPPTSRGMGELALDELSGVPLFVPRGVGPMESVVPTEFDDSTPAPQTMSDVASAGHEQLGVLAREVMSRSAPDAAAWIARSIGLDPI